MSFYVPAPCPAQRDKLGLALAGGGFRASLFHLGVLHRMAEMDLLRYVEVLSTVSGGSIVGALYILMLKQRLDRNAKLSRGDYEEIVKELEKAFVAGVQKDLRTRLLMNPLGILGVLLSHDSLGRRMGRIYQRYLYSQTVNALRGQDPALPRGGRLSTALWPVSKRLWPGWIPLRSVRFRPGGKEISGGIEGYNKTVLSQDEPGSAIPNFIVNSTALNSGAPFRFSSVEIGDPRLGYFRHDEAPALKARKYLLETSLDELREMLRSKPQMLRVNSFALDRRVAALALWWRTRDAASPELPGQWGEWTRVFAYPDVVDSMCATNFGRLRDLKLPAWYLLRGPTAHLTGGVPESAHLARFDQVLHEVDEVVSDQIINAVAQRTPLGDEVLDFALELYYLRSAEVMSWRMPEDFDGISLATAVAASANFPPVFPPLVLLGIYDDLHVTRLGLSDGGVYDNLGVTTLLDEGCTHIIVSDTGAPFEAKQRISSRYIGMISSLPGVLTEDVAEQQRTQLRERRRVSAGLANCSGTSPALLGLKEEYGLKGLAFFSIDSQNPPQHGAIKRGIKLDFNLEEVALLRTDLDSFGDMEVAALINSGYDRADRFIHEYFTEALYSARDKEAWNYRAAPPVPLLSSTRTACHAYWLWASRDSFARCVCGHGHGHGCRGPLRPC